MSSENESTTTRMLMEWHEKQSNIILHLTRRLVELESRVKELEMR